MTYAVDYETTEAILPENISLAYDGLVLNLLGNLFKNPHVAKFFVTLF